MKGIGGMGVGGGGEFFSESHHEMRKKRKKDPPFLPKLPCWQFGSSRRRIIVENNCLV